MQQPVNISVQCEENGVDIRQTDIVYIEFRGDTKKFSLNENLADQLKIEEPIPLIDSRGRSYDILSKNTPNRLRRVVQDNPDVTFKLNDPIPPLLPFSERGKEILKAVHVCISAYYIGQKSKEEDEIMKDLKDLDFINIIPSTHAELQYIIAEDKEENVYIGFRGSIGSEDFKKYNLKIRLIPETAGTNGCFHQGFLKIAQNFPFKTVFSKERYISSVCNYSFDLLFRSLQ